MTRRREDPWIHSFLYKLIRSKGFREYVNDCGMDFMKVTTTDALLAASVAKLGANLKRPKFEFDHQLRPMPIPFFESSFRALQFALLRFIKSFDRLLSGVDILCCDVKKALEFRKLDEMGNVSPLDHRRRCSPPLSDVIVML